MRIPSWVPSSFRFAALLLVLGWPLQAPAGIVVKQFVYFNIVPDSANPTNTVVTSFVDTFDGGGPLNNPDATPGSDFEWQVRIGSIAAADENSGLRLNPRKRGALFSIDQYNLLGQVLELQTPLSDPGAIDSGRSDFGIFGRYQIRDYGEYYAGIGLTDVFRGDGTRAIAATIERDGDGRYYGKFSNVLTGEILDRQEIDVTGGAYIDLFIRRESGDLESNFVQAGFAVLRSDLTFLNGGDFGMKALAFSDVVLSPVLFAAVLVPSPVPEPETWATLLAGLALVCYRIGALRRR